MLMKHELDRSTRKARWKRSLAAKLVTIGALMAGFLVVSGSPASAAAFTDVTWSVDNNMTAATGVSYTWTFTTVTTGTVASVELSVPTGTAGTPTITQVFGIGAGSVALAGTTVTYTVTTPASIAAGTPIYIELGGFTNTATASTGNTSTVETLSAVPATIDGPTASTNTVDFGDSNTAVTILLARTLVFTNDTSAFTLQPIQAASPTAATYPVTLTVLTNATNGYTLAADMTDSASFVDQEVTTGSATLTVNSFAAQAALTASPDSGATLATPYLASNYVGYNEAAAANVVTATAPTGNTADSLVLTNQIAADFNQPPGVYTGTIHYTATPSY